MLQLGRECNVKVSVRAAHYKPLVAAGLVLAFLLLAYVTLHVVARSESARARLERELSERTGYKVRIEDVSLTPGLGFVGRGMVVSEEGRAVLQAKSITAVVSPFDLFAGRISRLSFESPELHLSSKNLFAPSGQAAPSLTVGALNIEDGKVVLETGFGEGLAIKSIFLSASNVSLGEEAGLRLRAYVRVLGENAAVSIAGGPAGAHAEISVDQGDKPGAPAKGALRARFEMKPLTENNYQVNGSGTASGFRVGTKRVAGRFNSMLEIDGKLQKALLSLDLSGRGDEVSVLQLSLKLPFEWADSVFRVRAGRLHGKDLAWSGSGETQWTVKEAALLGEAVKEPGKPIQLTADFQITDGAFSRPGQSQAAEGLAAEGRFTYTDRDGAAVFSGEARIESLELLWNKFFGDFGKRKPSIAVDGSYSKNNDELKLAELTMALDSVGRIELKGQVERLLNDPVFDLDIRADNIYAEGFYDFFIREPFQINYPFLAQTRISGTGGLAGHARGTLNAFTLQGDVRLQDVQIQQRSASWRVGPVALSLPFNVRFPHTPTEPKRATAKAGSLVVGQVKSATTVIPKISATPILWNNSLIFREPIRVSLFGGAATIEGLAWKDIIGAPKDVTFSLKLDGLRLVELTEALGWYRFGGTLSGSIPNVRWVDESLRSEGTMILDVFSGRITVKGMEVEKPLSRIRSIKMDAVLDGLDLGQASKTFELGQISGVLVGTVDDLVITSGQPSQFRADVRTVDREGASQWISVEALDKITVLSSGNEAGPIYGGIAGLFDFFRYSKLGFKATLKNDRLVLRGVESRDGKEYLVVGTFLPPTVNIISHTQEIAFSELLRRLERIQKN